MVGLISSQQCIWWNFDLNDLKKGNRCQFLINMIEKDKTKAYIIDSQD